jgi:ADP-ribose pyrophosphatase YjhB (NUDIX family)
MAENVRVANRRASGVAVLFQNSVLLAKRSEKCHITGNLYPYAGYWSVFGGSIDEGETPVECAGRELLEESKIFVDFKFINFIDVIRDPSCDFYLHTYRSKKILIPQLCQEHSQFGWFNIGELKYFQDPIDARLVKCLISI